MVLNTKSCSLLTTPSRSSPSAAMLVDMCLRPDLYVALEARLGGQVTEPFEGVQDPIKSREIGFDDT